MFIIDVETKHKAVLIRALRKLRTTQSVVDGGIYREDKMYSQVHLETTLTENQVDEWACRVKAGVGYVGVAERP
jgi:hypothetical protein